MKLPFMISCLKATELTEKKLAGELGWIQGLQLGVHRLLCDACRRYGQQSQLLDQLLKKDLGEPDPTITRGVVSEHDAQVLEERILKNIRARM